MYKIQDFIITEATWLFFKNVYIIYRVYPCKTVCNTAFEQLS